MKYIYNLCVGINISKTKRILLQLKQKAHFAEHLTHMFQICPSIWFHLNTNEGIYKVMPKLH